jgi:hypothetical protein
MSVKQPVKVSTGLKDAWGQEIFLGDLVVECATGGWVRDTPYVVTRVGSAENIQKNGCSYSKPENHVVVTAQYVAYKGQAEHEKLLDIHPIQLEAVKKKNPPVLCAVAAQSYLMKNDQRKFFVLRWEDSEDGRKEYAKTINTIGGGYFSFLNLPSAYGERGTKFRPYAKGISTKKLMELGQALGIDFSLWYNMEITDPQVISILTKYV